MSRQRERGTHLNVTPLSDFNMTSARARRRVVCKEKVEFPVQDWRTTRSTGNCHIENHDILVDMLKDGELDKPRSNKIAVASSHQKFKENNETSHSSSDRSISRQSLQEQRDLEISLIEQLKKMSIAKQNETARRKKDVMFSNLAKDIAESVDLMNSIDKSLSWAEETKKIKSRRLFEDWNSRVHDPIKVSCKGLHHSMIYFYSNTLKLRKWVPHQQKTNKQYETSWQENISNQVKLIDSKKLNKKKNEDYDNFLAVSNRKSAIFRDIIIESECKLTN